MQTESNPIRRFQELYDQIYRDDIPETAAMILATVSPAGQPSARVVLLKSFDESGFVFYTNLQSQKARDLKANPGAALCFYWEPVHHQVRVQGQAEQVSDEEADAYFATRPRGSQIGAWASRQSSVLASRVELERAFQEFQSKFAGKDVPRPPFWSGFRVIPDRIEFWHRRENRLHERTVYLRKNAGWEKKLLYP